MLPLRYQELLRDRASQAQSVWTAATMRELFAFGEIAHLSYWSVTNPI